MATSAQDFLKLNPGYVGRANVARQPEPTQAPQKQRGKGGWLSSIISELGGAGGAWGGAAAGAAAGSVVPGIGNIVGGIAGGIIGGFGGGAAGKLAENKLRDNEYRVGDALKEGAVSGAFGGIGPAWQGARGLSALSKASGGVAGIGGIGQGVKFLDGFGDDAAKLAGKAIVKNGAKSGKAIGQASLGVISAQDLAYASRKGLQSMGDGARAWQRGINPGTVGAQESPAYNKALDGVNKWFGGISKNAQFTNADDAMKALSKSYKLSPEAAQVFGKSNAEALGNKFLQNIDDNPILKAKLTGANGKVAENLLNDALSFGKKKNGDFIEFMSGKINSRYRTVSSGGSAGSVESQVLEAFRDAGKSIIDKNLTTRSGVNKQFSNLLGASKQLGKTITGDTSAGVRQGEGIGRIISSVAGPGVDVAGRAMQQAGKLTKYTTPIAKGSLLRGALSDSSIDSQQEYTQPTGGNTMQEMTDAASQSANGEFNDPSAMASQENMNQPQSAYSLQQAIQDYQSAPNAKVQQQVMAYYDFVSKAEATQNKASASNNGIPSNVGKVSASAYGLAQQGLNGLSQLAKLIQKDPGVVGRTSTPGRGLPVVGGYIGKASGTTEYDTLGFAAVSSLLRAQSGAAVPDSEVRAYMRHYLPRAGDSKESIQRKLETLQYDFQTVIQGGGNDSSSLADSITQYGGQ